MSEPEASAYSRRATSWVALALAVLVWSVGLDDARAQPANDDCGSPSPLFVGATVAVDTTGATTDTILCTVTDGVWYEVTFPTSALYTFEYLASGSNLAVVLDCIGGQGICTTSQSGVASFSLPMGAGETFLVLVGGGSGDLLVSSGSAAVPGDTCATAFPLELNGYEFSVPLALASLDGGVPTCIAGATADVWGELTVPIDGELRFSTRSSSVSSIELFDSCGGLSLICETDPQIQISTLQVAAGETFVMRVTRSSTFLAGGDVNAVVIAPSTTPPNDACLDAIPVDFGVPAPYDSAGATPKLTGDGYFYGVWHTFTAPGPGTRRYRIYRSPASFGRVRYALSPPCGSLSFALPTLAPGESIRILVEGQGELTVGAQSGFVRGDLDGNRQVELVDLIQLARELGGERVSTGVPELSIANCPAARDLNADQIVSLLDLIYGLQFLFASGQAPSAPWPSCGIDPSANGLDCVGTSPCNPYAP